MLVQSKDGRWREAEVEVNRRSRPRMKVCSPLGSSLPAAGCPRLQRARSQSRRALLRVPNAAPVGHPSATAAPIAASAS
eukprot:6192357-Pleurochrysis_carterae.AAC.5